MSSAAVYVQVRCMACLPKDAKLLTCRMQLTRGSKLLVETQSSLLPSVRSCPGYPPASQSQYLEVQVGDKLPRLLQFLEVGSNSEALSAAASGVGPGSWCSGLHEDLDVVEHSGCHMQALCVHAALLAGLLANIPHVHGVCRRTGLSSASGAGCRLLRCSSGHSRLWYIANSSDLDLLMACHGAALMWPGQHICLHSPPSHQPSDQRANCSVQTSYKALCCAGAQGQQGHRVPADVCMRGLLRGCCAAATVQWQRGHCLQPARPHEAKGQRDQASSFHSCQLRCVSMLPHPS